MAKNMESPLQERLYEVVKADPRYPTEAYQFVFEALDFTVRNKYSEAAEEDPQETNRHVKGQDLLKGIQSYALEVFGCLAVTVFDSWNLQGSEDFGEIVFNLVEHGLMGSQEHDCKEDFAEGFNGMPLNKVFAVYPILDYCHERGEWKASYKNAQHG